MGQPRSEAATPDGAADFVPDRKEAYRGLVTDLGVAARFLS